MRRPSITLRLTLWYTIAMMGGLGLFGTTSFFALRHAMLVVKRETLGRREQRLLNYLQTRKAAGDTSPWTFQLKAYAESSPENALIQIFDADGRRLFPQENAAPARILWPSQPNCSDPCVRQTGTRGQRLLVMRHDILLYGKRAHLCVASSLEDNFDILTRFRTAMLWCLPLLLIVSIGGGHSLSARALQPIERMVEAALTIGARNLSKRLPVVETGDALQRLAEAWNDLLARLEQAVERQRQFTSDASHDLRTSIGVILATGQLVLRHQRTEEEYREAVSTMVSECEATSHLLEDLLLLARGDALAAPVQHTSLDATRLVKETSQRALALAAAKGQRMELSTPSEPVRLAGDRKLLQRLLSILIDNAVKYTPRGGTITVCLQQEADGVVHLQVQDTGIGISPEVLPKIFDRFYRADAARNRDSGGFGLGLAIARWIATIHSAQLTVKSTPDAGSIFAVHFPAGPSKSI